MKKQLFLTLTLLASVGSTRINASGPEDLLFGLGCLVGVGAIATESVNAYQKGDSGAFNNALSLAAAGAAIGYLAGENRKDAAVAGATFGLGIGLSSPIAHNKTIVNRLEKIHVLNFLFTDEKVTGKENNQIIPTGSGATARSAVTYLAISAALIPLVTAITGVNVSSYTIRQNS